MAPTKRPRRAVIYCRIGSDRKGREFGVDRQEAHCRRLADPRGWHVVSVLVDNDITGTGNKKRPGYDQLLTMLQAAGNGVENQPRYDGAWPGGIIGRAPCCWRYASGRPRWHTHPHRRASNRPPPWGNGTSLVCLHSPCRSSYPGCWATAHSADMADVSTAGALTAPPLGSGHSPGPRPPTASPPL